VKGKTPVKKIISGIVTAFLCIVTALSLIAVVKSLVSDDPSILGYRTFYVMTGSMEPTIPTNALVITKKDKNADYKVGDIITFESDDPDLAGKTNTHRIQEIIETDYGVAYVTKGDNNPVADNYTVSGDQVFGRVVFNTGKVQWIGTLLGFVMDPKGFIILIIIPVVAIIGSTMKDYVRLYKEELEKIKNGGESDSEENEECDEQEAEPDKKAKKKK